MENNLYFGFDDAERERLFADLVREDEKLKAVKQEIVLKRGLAFKKQQEKQADGIGL